MMALEQLEQGPGLQVGTTIAPAATMADLIHPRAIMHTDPRRLGRRAMLAVWCWCGRFYTVTPEEADKAIAAKAAQLCPNPDCGGRP